MEMITDGWVILHTQVHRWREGEREIEREPHISRNGAESSHNQD